MSKSYLNHLLHLKRDQKFKISLMTLPFCANSLKFLFFQFSLANLQGWKVPDGVFSFKSPVFYPDVPETWSVMPSGYKFNYFDDMIENGLQSYADF